MIRIQKHNESQTGVVADEEGTILAPDENGGGAVFEPGWLPAFPHVPVSPTKYRGALLPLGPYVKLALALVLLLHWLLEFLLRMIPIGYQALFFYAKKVLGSSRARYFVLPTTDEVKLIWSMDQ